MMVIRSERFGRISGVEFISLTKSHWSKAQWLFTYMHLSKQSDFVQPIL